MDYVIHAHGARKCVIITDKLPGGEHEVIADRRMRVSEILGSQAILRGQTVQVWHGGISNHFGIAVVFLNNEDDMAKVRNSARHRRGRPGGLGPLGDEKLHPTTAASMRHRANKPAFPL